MPNHTPEEQRKNALVGLGQLGFTNPDEGEIQGFLASNPAGSITGEALAPQPALNIQPTSQVPIPSVESLPLTEPTAITPKEPDLIGDVERLTKQLEGVDVEAGVVERTARERQDVINLQKQIKFFQAEALRSERLAAEQAETIGGASASVARARTENTARAMELAALAEAVGQNFALSETLARRAEETRFAQKEQDLETARQNLLANFEEFSPTEKRRAEQALARIGRDKEFLEEQKAERLGIQKVAIEAARSGITDSEVLQRIQSAPSLLEANRILAEVRPAEPSVITPEGELTAGEKFQAERAERTVQSVDELLVKVDKTPGIFGRTAALPIPGFLRSTAFRNFEAELNTLKASIAFGELTAMREASRTGGALGQVSNIELALLESALGALSMSQSPQNLKEQLNKIKSGIQRWQKAKAGAIQDIDLSDLDFKF